jgi:hypothetical protein
MSDQSKNPADKRGVGDRYGYVHMDERHELYRLREKVQQYEKDERRRHFVELVKFSILSLVCMLLFVQCLIMHEKHYSHLSLLAIMFAFCLFVVNKESKIRKS